MRVHVVSIAALVVVAMVGCTSEDAPSAADGTGTPSVEVDPEAAPTASPSPSPSPSPTPSPEERVLGAGTVTVDGTELPVTGDCDLSKAFGQERVPGLGDDEIDLLLAVDNLAGGEPAGPFAVSVRLLGSGPMEGRTVASVSREEGQSVTWEGEVVSAGLHDRQQREFLDVATLHLEATQQPVGPGAPAGSRDLVVDVACAISRPG